MIAAPTDRPKVLLVFSIISLFIAAGIGVIAYADQHRRVENPARYAERRCEAVLPDSLIRTKTFDDCVARERAKSSIESILPFFVISIIVTLFGIAGVIIGRAEVRAQREREKKLAEGIGNLGED